MHFEWVSDHVALDYAATVAWRDTEPVDLLSAPSDLSEWAVRAGLVDRRFAVDQEQWEEALLLREAIYRLARAVVEGGAAAAGDLRLLRQQAAGRAVVPVLTGLGDLERTGSCGQVLAGVAVQASELLGSPTRSLIRPCRGSRCTRLFLDRSRAGTRRWCAKDACGSRANSAAYRQRHGSSAS